uniref:ABC transporter domain-containing protein n=1 Tax=Panagrolaimus sp. JU765 TaxID=591449 RepID=A0AC34PVL2_9BILA
MSTKTVWVKLYSFGFFGIIFGMNLFLSAHTPHGQDFNGKTILFSLINPFIAVSYANQHFHVVLKYVPYVSMIFHIFCMIMLNLYFDYVLPIDSSPKKHPLFFLGIGKPSEDVFDEGDNNNEQKSNSMFEVVNETAGVGIAVSNVTKVYNKSKVVNNVSFKAFEGQVTALLGHNGAGKSTLFGCLTGFLKPTSGTIDVKEDASIGYCPQWDPLFPLLTVEEHLKFYSQLKTGTYTDEDINTTLKNIDLFNSRQTRARDLSGGMKRKLSVGMSLIGGSQIVLLDEPTAGMDPLARRGVIDMVNNIKHDRTVLLTTHYMDEAEMLSDRILIMAKGNLMCNGSGDFLKKKLSTGIILSVVFDEKAHSAGVENLRNFATTILQITERHIPGSLIEGPIGNQFTILLPFGTQRQFPCLFDELEKNRDQLKIGSFGISTNTLEQVFIRITEKTENETKIDTKALIENYVQITHATDKSTFCQQFGALMYRKLNYLKRQPMHIIIPAAILLLVFVLTMIASLDHSSSGENVFDLSICGKSDVGIAVVAPDEWYPHFENYYKMRNCTQKLFRFGMFYRTCFQLSSSWNRMYRKSPLFKVK